MLNVITLLLIELLASRDLLYIENEPIWIKKETKTNLS